MTDRYYAIEQAALAAGVKQRHIERWIKDGLIRPLTVDGCDYVTVPQIEAAQEAAKRHATLKLARSLTRGDA